MISVTRPLIKPYQSHFNFNCAFQRMLYNFTDNCLTGILLTSKTKQFIYVYMHTPLFAAEPPFGADFGVLEGGVASIWRHDHIKIKYPRIFACGAR